MKLTVTDRGLDYIRQLALENYHNTHTHTMSLGNTLPHSVYSHERGSLRETLSQTQMFSRTHSTLGSMKSKGLTGTRTHYNTLAKLATMGSGRETPVLETLLPAVLAANKPMAIEVNQPKIALSSSFQKRYFQGSPNTVATPSEAETNVRVTTHWGKELLSEPKVAAGIMGQSNRFLPKGVAERNARLKLRRTLERLKLEGLPDNLNQVESVASMFLAKTLRYQKLLERQEVMKKRRFELDSLRKSVLQRSLLKDAAELEGNTQLICNLKDHFALTGVHDTKRQRYRDRVQNKHQHTVKLWHLYGNLQKLAAPPERKSSIAYSKLAAAHTVAPGQGLRRLSSTLSD
jgi:hypothetical protein